MKLAHTLLTATLLGLFALSSALAAEGTGKADGPVAQACRQELQTLCPDVEPGDGRLKACVRKNHSKLSDACKDALKAQRNQSAK